MRKYLCPMLKHLLLILELALIVAFALYADAPEVKAFAAAHPRAFVFAKYLVFAATVDALRRAVRLWYTVQFRVTNPGEANFLYGINHIATVVLLLGTVVYLFQLFGVDIRTLITSVSIVAAAIAIVTKEYISDFLVGLYFSFSKNFTIGDYVRMGDYRGKITELQIFKLRLLNDDDDSVLIPNSKVYNTEITNYTRHDVRLMSVDFELGVAHLSMIEQLEADLIASLDELRDLIEPDSYNLRIVDMRKDAIIMKFQYKQKHFDREVQRSIRKKTVRRVFNYIASRGGVGGGDAGVPSSV